MHCGRLPGSGATPDSAMVSPAVPVFPQACGDAIMLGYLVGFRQPAQSRVAIRIYRWGVSKLMHFLSCDLCWFWTSMTASGASVAKPMPFEKYWRIRPLVFSLRSHYQCL